MTLMEYFGCAFISFGPCLALFIFTIARDPLRVIVMIASGFFWLLSLLLSSLVWFAVVPLRDQLAFGLVFSVLFQELFRLLFYKLIRKADEGLLMVSQTGQSDHITPKDVTNRHIMAYVSGVGFGVLSGTFSVVNILADMAGPGTIGIHGDSQYFFITSAFLSQCFILLHVVWSVIFYYALDHKKHVLVAVVVGSHMFISCLTLLNQSHALASHPGDTTRSSPLYLATLLPAYAVLLANGGVAFKVAGGSLGNIRRAFTGRPTPLSVDD